MSRDLALSRRAKNHRSAPVGFKAADCCLFWAERQADSRSMPVTAGDLTLVELG
eukprot:CAMPEP_0195060908 /NCGR_PEP_ID=MMETSP0448-20130528/8062_1 /TAXON_ID=66468 /ORGANISM="Heterocapsa triquestra, Strain CCMP 448" /LENGTH=53 /DNA_ID=CAMNT_0040091415 /DNA_START=87 /DNA_END=245 /DNA_ORIENTATION=+